VTQRQCLGPSVFDLFRNVTLQLWVNVTFRADCCHGHGKRSGLNFWAEGLEGLEGFAEAVSNWAGAVSEFGETLVFISVVLGASAEERLKERVESCLNGSILPALVNQAA
jgi:hypothetical protein